MPDWDRPWPAAAATGLGPLPGTDPREAMRVAAGEAPDLPFLPELADRGAGSERIGRTAVQLVGLHVDIHAGRWRLVDGRSGDQRRALETLERDLDALEEVAGGHAGALKVQLLGPWSLAAALELPKGDKALSDAGAVEDVAVSLAEAVTAHLAEVRHRVPRARVLVQFDEPLLPAVMTGRLPSASGWGRLPIPEEEVLERVLERVFSAAGGDAGAWCDAPGVPLERLRRTGARFVAFGAGRLDGIPEEELGEAIEAGTGILLGLIPAENPEAITVEALAAPARRVWERLGLGEGHWDSVVVTPAGDLGEVSMDQAGAALARCRDVAETLGQPASERDPNR